MLPVRTRKLENVLSGDYFPLVSIIFFFLLTMVFHAGTYAGLDSDFQGHALRSKLVWVGKTPYLDFFDHKPPLYYLILLPGNLLGGQLFSFFIIHLLYVGIVFSLVFHYGSRINKNFDFFSGFWAWVFMIFMTALQFFRYGNLNAGIIYPVLGLNLISFFILFEIKSRFESGIDKYYWLTLIMGLLSGLAFLERFSVSAVFLFLILLVYLKIFVKSSVWKLFKISIIYGIGMIIPVLITLVIWDFPIKQTFEDLIIFNFFYSKSDQPVTLLYGAYLSTASLVRYSYILLALCIIAFLCFVCKKIKNEGPKEEKRLKKAFFQKESVIPWLIIYILVELSLVILQKTYDKQYPIFPCFIPISLLAAMSLAYITSLFPQKIEARYIASLMIVLILVFWTANLTYKNIHKFFAVKIWPENILASEIKKYARSQDDLFTIDYMPYIYLEADMIPPIERFWYLRERWDMYGQRKDLEKDLWMKLEKASPAVILISEARPKFQGDYKGEDFDRLISNYYKKEKFYINYRRATVFLYLNKSVYPQSDQ